MQQDDEFVHGQNLSSLPPRFKVRTSASAEPGLLENIKRRRKTKWIISKKNMLAPLLGLKSAGKEDPDCRHWWKKRVTGFLEILSTFQMAIIATEESRTLDFFRVPLQDSHATIRTFPLLLSSERLRIQISYIANICLLSDQELIRRRNFPDKSTKHFFLSVYPGRVGLCPGSSRLRQILSFSLQTLVALVASP
jgi:hypothetical protein